MNFEIIVRKKEKGEVISEKLIREVEIKRAETILELGFRHKEQIEVIGAIQDEYLPMQVEKISEKYQNCPKCEGKTKKNGMKYTDYHSSLSDHKLRIQGYACRCGWQKRPTIHGEYGTSVHPDLTKMQGMLGAKMPYKEAEETLEKLNCKKRSANNHVKIAECTNMIGEILSKIKSEEVVESKGDADDLYMYVDGGHVKDKDREKRSFEALLAAVFKADSYKKSVNSNTAIPKHIAASAINDGGKTINKYTLDAAKKEGMNKNTEITAFCDGAANCWSIVNSLEGHCKNITKILDWYHIRQAYDRAKIALPDYTEKLDSSKYKVWHGKTQEAVSKLDELTKELESAKVSERKIDKVISIKSYLLNNIDKLVNYMERKEANLPYTSSIAETIVESQINTRFKRKQKMQWTRENAHNVLQIKATMHSNEWNLYEANIDNQLTLKAA